MFKKKYINQPESELDGIVTDRKIDNNWSWTLLFYLILFL